MSGEKNQNLNKNLENKKVEKEEDKKNDIFENMEINKKILERLSEIKVGDKIIVNDNNIDIDNRFFQFFRRWYNNDNRYLSIIFIENCINLNIRSLRNKSLQIEPEIVEECNKLLEKCVNGIKNLGETYKGDKVISVRLEFLKNKIGRYLKKNI